MPKSKARRKRPQPRPSSTSTGRYNSPDSLPTASDPARFDAWMAVTWRLGWTILAGLACLCTTVILAFVLRAQQHDVQVFENAPTCAPGESVGCRMLIPVTIESRGQSGSSKDPTYYLDLSGLAPADGAIDLPGQTALWNEAVAGDSATAIVWDGAVVRIEDEGIDDSGDAVIEVSGDTSQAPGVRTVLIEGMLITAAVGVAASLVFALRIAQSHRGAVDGWTRLLVPLELPALLAPFCFAIGVLLGQRNESLTEAVAVGAGLTAFASVILVFTWLRNR